MADTQIPLPQINNAIREVLIALEERYHRPAQCWNTMTETDLWRELVACILGSRVRFEVAHAAVERLDKLGLFSKPHTLSCFQQYELQVMEALLWRGVAGTNRAYPFSRVRAKQVREAAERLYGCGVTLHSMLGGSRDVRDVRCRLIREISGLGPKQASLFLRNIGFTAHVAVLDTHVLAYMHLIGLTESTVKYISALPKYEVLERAFIEYAYSLGYDPDYFDLAVWVVMRLVKEGETI